MDKRTIQELMDVCRPDGDDLQQPELAPLAERMAGDARLAESFRQAKQFDAAVGEAFDDVPVPEGLRSRLLETLRNAAVRTPIEEAAAPRSTVERAAPPRVGTRRRILAASLAALAAGVLAIVGVRTFTGVPIDRAQLARQAGDWTNLLEAGDWSERMDAAPLEARPIPDAILALPEAWQAFSTQYDSDAAAYRLDNGRRGALLFVFDGAGRESDLSGSPPRAPQPGTGGWQFGIWQCDGFVFVLAVEGNRADYRRLVKTALDA